MSTLRCSPTTSMADATPHGSKVTLDVMERQLEELDAVLMVLGDEAEDGLVLELATPRPLAIMRSIVASGDVSGSHEAIGALILRVSHTGCKVTLHITIPSSYLDTDLLQVQCAAGSSETSARILKPIKAAIDEVGIEGECLLVVIQAFQEACEDEVSSSEHRAAAAEHAAAVFAASGSATDSSPSLPALKLAGQGSCWLDVGSDALAWAGLPSTCRVWRGDELTDRKSVFQAFACAAATRAEAFGLGALLRRDRRIAKATHNMMAFRLVRPGDGVLVADNDEDGESGAGGRMSHLLEMMGVDGAVVIVTRWYGGVLLGPKRFAHISNCAREALEDSGLSPRAGATRA